MGIQSTKTWFAIYFDGTVEELHRRSVKEIEMYETQKIEKGYCIGRIDKLRLILVGPQIWIESFFHSIG